MKQCHLSFFTRRTPFPARVCQRLNPKKGIKITGGIITPGKPDRAESRGYRRIQKAAPTRRLKRRGGFQTYSVFIRMAIHHTHHNILTVGISSEHCRGKVGATVGISSGICRGVSRDFQLYAPETSTYCGLFVFTNRFWSSGIANPHRAIPSSIAASRLRS